MKSPITQKGFTLIETLVAITILLISIAGPLTIAEQGLTEAVTSQDRLTASYLAQDLMEYVKNTRDDNMLAGNAWINTFANCTAAGSSHMYGGGYICDYDTLTGSGSLGTCTPSQASSTLCQLYLATFGGASYYTPNSSAPGATATKFGRAFTLTPLNGGSFTTATSSLLTVSVAWNTGTISDQVVLQDVIFNTTR